MTYDYFMTMGWQEQMRLMEFISGSQPVADTSCWPGVVIAGLMLLAMHALFIKAACHAGAMLRECNRRNGVARTLAVCLLAAPLLYVGGTKGGGGGTGTSTGTGTGNVRGGASTGEPVVRGGEGPPGDDDAGPPQVVFQSMLPDTPDYPVCFTGHPETLVQTVMLAAVGNAADLATLIDAPETARIRIAQGGDAPPPMTAMELSVTAQFTPAQWLVAEVDFEEPVPLGDLFFGDTAGHPLWQRAWQGEIAEAVCFSAPPCADVRAGVANYLAVKGGFRGYRATSAQRQAAINAGLNYGLVWGTVVIVR